MKIDARRSHILKALEGLGGGVGGGGAHGAIDPARLRELMKSTGASAAEVQSVLDEMGDRFAPDARRSVERFLAQESFATPERTASGVVTGGKRIHDVRAQKHQPWWKGVVADPLPAPLHPEPARDVEVHGERFTKDDVVSLLRSLGR
jgi:hypothetical protein